jgi:hemerythrin superfamily protein
MLPSPSALRGPVRSVLNPALQQSRYLRSSAILRALLSDVIKSHHREIEECYTKALNGKTHDEKERWGNQFTWELARHAIGEDLVLYPKLEQHLPDGKEIAHRDRVHTNEVRLYPIDESSISL